MTVEEYCRWATDLGIVDPAEIEAVLADTKEAQDVRTSQELANLLVRKKLLTPYQARQIYSGKGQSLLLGNCIILNKIGQGGMGKVYKARHRQMERLVAIKILPASLTRSPSFVARFHQEVKVVAKLDHPNIVTAYDAGEAHGIQYLVMQYVDGKDFLNVLRQNGPLSIVQTLRSLRQVAEGLAYAHQQGVIHRDVKPANLLIDRQGHVKILDMGLARIYQENQETTQQGLTESGLVMGTAAYMAPEQALNSKNADERSDVYSLGCVLYHLLTGSTMYQTGTFWETALAHREQPIPELLSPQDSVPPALDAVYRKMVAKQPDRRYQTMVEVVTALAELLQRYDSPSQSGGLIEDSNLQRFVNGLEQAQTPTQILQTSDPTATKQLTTDSNPLFIGAESTFARSDLLRSRSRGKSASPQRIVMLGSAAFCLILLVGWGMNVAFSQKAPSGELLIRFDSLGTNPVSDEELTLRHMTTNRMRTVPLTESEISISGLEEGPYEVLVPPAANFVVDVRTFSLVSGQPSTIVVSWPEPASDAATAFWSRLPDDAPPPAKIPFTVDEARSLQQAWADYLGVPVEFQNSVGMTLRLIPPGEFVQGLTEAQGAAINSETELSHLQFLKGGVEMRIGPHRVCLSRPFYIGTTEVTQQQFKAITGENPSRFSPTGVNQELAAGIDTSNYPVDTTWFAAVEFCKRLSESEQREIAYDEFEILLSKTGYRLPTEAEWEFACRAGTSTRWWWGDRAFELTDQEWVQESSVGNPHPVATAQPNPFGLFDMHGNLWEWCHDWYESFRTQFWDELTIDPVGAAINDYKVGRGGAYHNPVQVGSSEYRGLSAPDRTDGEISFRVVLPLNLKKTP